MENFTYEKDDRKTVLEKYEWDNLWIESTDDNESNRVLYIGDSISCGTRNIATMQTQKEILFDGFASSKAVDNPFLKESISLFISQLPKLEMILFNSGLHGWHLEDTSEYAKYYEEIVIYLLEKYSKVPMFLVLTTYIRDEARIERVKARNSAVLKIADKYQLPVIDLYTVTEKNKELLSKDGVHFTPEGYEIIAKEIISVIS